MVPILGTKCIGRRRRQPAGRFHRGHMNILWVGCADSNFSQGRRGHQPQAIVIHSTMGSLVGADNQYLDPRYGSSAHYGVGRDGRIHHYVSESDTAYHASVVAEPTWAGIRRGAWGAFVNPDWYTIGIEHEGFPGTPWPELQYQLSAELVAEIAGRWGLGIDREHVVGHSEIRATENCPGLGVDLERLVEMARGFAQSSKEH